MERLGTTQGSVFQGHHQPSCQSHLFPVDFREFTVGLCFKETFVKTSLANSLLSDQWCVPHLTIQAATSTGSTCACPMEPNSCLEQTVSRCFSRPSQHAKSQGRALVWICAHLMLRSIS